MPRLTKKGRERLRNYIIENVRENATDIIGLVSEEFSVSRQTAHRHLQKLVEAGILTASGQTKARKYELAVRQTFAVTVHVSENFEEDLVWRHAMKILSDLPENVRDICQYGMTEMLNNVASHSGSEQAEVIVSKTAADVTISIKDTGIGIFTKIQQDFDLPDPRQALLELSKGKLTSDSTRHTGEGIFFTSRMFDKFVLSSGELDFCRSNKKDDWLLEVGDQPDMPGTHVWMRISINATHTDKEVFLRYAPEASDYGFTRTHVPIKLAVYEGEKLMSRSQARRLLSRVDKFAEVFLDFQGVRSIGQPFADEIFRVFKNRHPGTQLVYANATNDVERIISHVRSTEEFNSRQQVLSEPLDNADDGDA